MWEGVPAIKRHPKGSHAASTPATDGRYVVAMFGSEGLYCFDVEGNLVWEKDLGRLDAGWYMMEDGAEWGFASSPVIHGDRVLLQVDVRGDCYLAAFDLATGDELWRTERDDVPTWSSPSISEHGGRAQVIVNGYRHLGGYDLATGAPLWWLAATGDIPVPTPVVDENRVYFTSAHGRGAPIVCVDATAATGEFVMDADESDFTLWSHARRGNYMQTPIVYGDYLYCCHDSGALACYDKRTGEMLYRERLGDGSTGFTASGVAGDGKLYFLSEEGEIFVVRAGPEFEVLGSNATGEETMASPAIWNGRLIVRSRRHLMAVGGTE